MLRKLALLKSVSFSFLMISSLSTVGSTQAGAEELPGKGVVVQALKSTIPEEAFQTVLVLKALKRLGFKTAPVKSIEYEYAHREIADGKATFMANHWAPLHVDFYANAGGDKKLFRKGVYSKGALQGYLIDKKTADKYRITKISQLKNPRIAKLFDIDGDGKADLNGCNVGWACAKVIDHHLKIFKLRKHITHHKGDYSKLIKRTISRFKSGKPVLYYTWTPYWISGVLVPYKDVVWLQVPFSSLPGAREDVDTRLPDGKNYGFQGNNQRIVANREFVKKHPVAGKLFEIMKVSSNDISFQNSQMYSGENSDADIERHVDQWIKNNQATFEGWIKTALAAN